ncbi:MAG: Uma2 family endonuclease [Cyanobacteria bacterium P01_E01_bin.43]
MTLDDPEERRILSRVSWAQYEELLADLGDASAYRVHFLNGVLEILAPSLNHESNKTRIGDLLLLYFLETETEYFPMGFTTLKKFEQQAGGEPDESYCIGTNKEFPDLAIEVIVPAAASIAWSCTDDWVCEKFGFGKKIAWRFITNETRAWLSSLRPRAMS